MFNLKSKKLFLLDMDGTIYLDNDIFDGTMDFLKKIKNKNNRYLFLTNNSSKSAKDYVRKLKNIGIDAEENDFLTSTEATCVYIKNNYSNKKFYAFGTKSFVDELLSKGINVTTELSNDIDGIILSNDTELTFKKLDDTCRLLKNKDIIYIATNPDWVCPTSYGFVPDCGSFAEIIYKATNRRPHFIGKPNPDMILLSLERFGYNKEDAIMIGDRVYTDIASGYNAGIDTIFVLSGEGTMEDAKNTDTPPTYIFNSIKDILDLI